MEEAGVGPALRRGVELLSVYCPGEFSEIPGWFTELDFGNAFHRADVWTVGAVVYRLRRAEDRLRRQAADQYGAPWTVNAAKANLLALPPWAAAQEEAQMRMAFALGRLALGAAIEAAFALHDCESRHDEPSFTTPTPPTTARMYNDALLVAVWTSAHAEYVSYIQSGVEEPPHPGVHSFPNSTSEYDFGGLFAMRSCTRMCPKPALPLLQLFQRSLNTGNRGWISLIETALQDSVATRLIIVNAMIVGLVGMHAMLAPSKRAPWNKRLATNRILQHTLTDSNAKAKLTLTAAATKEGIRRLVATFLAASPAFVEGLSASNQGLRAMLSPPVALPSRRVAQLSETLARCGLEIASGVGQSTDAYTDILSRAFESTDDATRCDAAWLTKTTPGTNKTPCINLFSDIWASCFRANFLAFWAHSTSNSARAARLDSSQHRAIHGLNAVTKLVAALPLRDQLDAQRVALGNISSSLLTVNETAKLLGLSAPSTQIRNVTDSLRFLRSVGPAAAARMFVFARTAWVAEEVLTVELGERTTALQIEAVYKRLRRQDYKPGGDFSELPLQATHLHVCLECKRVCSAHLSEPSKPGQTFTELGTSSSMLCTECKEEEKWSTHILCAKRSSAALRTALTLEESIVETEVEGKEINMKVVEEILTEGRVGSSANADDTGGGLAARVRRDSKTALEQRSRAFACGEQKLLTISIIGRAVRVFNDWYALCALCGGMLRVLPAHRFGGEICCCKCDGQMLGLPAPTPIEQRVISCRFCNAVDPEKQSTRWKVVKAPLDTSGDNAKIPPALRRVFYCPKHYRPWISSAHRVLATRVILSHIAHNAKPITNTTVQRTAEELGFQEEAKKKRRRGRSSGSTEQV